MVEKFSLLSHVEKHLAAVALAQAQEWLRRQVTVQNVIDCIDGWLDDAGGIDEGLMTEHGRWLARSDREALAFPEELYWAAFYLTGSPH